MRTPTLGGLLHSLYRWRALREGDARSDADLLERFAKARDQEAFAALMHRHGPMVLAVCQRLLPDRHEAEDAFQATFLVLVRKSGGLRQPQQLAPWLHGVAYRIALRLRHRSARWQPVPDGLDPEQAQRSDPLDRLAWQEIRAILDEEIQRLPSKYRLPVVLCYLQGQSYAEAARSLGWPAGTVSVRLARARQKLRDRFVRRGLGLSASLFGGLLGQEALAAPVPAALFTATVQAGLCGAAGLSALAGVVSQQVITLTEGVLHTMWLTKLKTTVFVAAAVLVVGLGGTSMTGFPWNPRSEAQTPAVPLRAGGGDALDALGESKQLDDLERQLRMLERQVQLKRSQLSKLRQGDALDQIEKAVKKLKQANAAEPDRRAAVVEFEQAFGKLKTGLQGDRQFLGVRLSAQKALNINDFRQPDNVALAAGMILTNGNVLQVDPELKQVLLSKGRMNGIQKGQVYRAYRNGMTNPDQTGWLRISEANSNWSIATILGDFGPRAPLRPGDFIQRHDGPAPKMPGDGPRPK